MVTTTCSGMPSGALARQSTGEPNVTMLSRSRERRYAAAW